MVGPAFHLDKFRATYRCSYTQRVSFYVSMLFLTVAAGGFLLLWLFRLMDIMSRSASSMHLIHHGAFALMIVHICLRRNTEKPLTLSNLVLHGHYKSKCHTY